MSENERTTEPTPAASSGPSAWLTALAAVPVRLPAHADTFDPLTAAHFARLAALSYSYHETDGGAELRGLLAPAGLAVVETFAWLPPDDGPIRGQRRDRGLEAYLAEHDQYVVLVFRGTEDARDWATNLQVGKRKLKVAGRTIRLHAGFLRSYQQVGSRIEAALDRTLAQRSRPLFVIGHSLGGALAQIATAVSRRPELAACYTYGAPRVAATWFRRTLRAPHHRVVNGWDVVPIVPPVLLGYGHTGQSHNLRRDPPATVITAGRSAWRATWINVRSLAGLAFGRDWVGLRDHEIENYVVRLDSVAAPRALAN